MNVSNKLLNSTLVAVDPWSGVGCRLRYSTSKNDAAIGELYLFYTSVNLVLPHCESATAIGCLASEKIITLVKDAFVFLACQRGQPRTTQQVWYKRVLR